MVLPDVVLSSRASCSNMSYNGVDMLEHCLDKQHFKQYPYKVNYNFNSRGFRDTEWPLELKELQNSVWCVGDSFTVGIGQPFDHIWPQVLQSNINKRTISVAMDGASNQWIARRAQQIAQQTQPANMVIMWSYFHRREHPDPTLLDEDRRQHYCDDRTVSWQQDVENFANCLRLLENLDTNIVHAFVPYSIALLGNNIEYSNLKCIGEIQQIDKARDGLHFDINTSRLISSQLMSLLVL